MVNNTVPPSSVRPSARPSTRFTVKIIVSVLAHVITRQRSAEVQLTGSEYDSTDTTQARGKPLLYVQSRTPPTNWQNDVQSLESI